MTTPKKSPATRDGANLKDLTVSVLHKRESSRNRFRRNRSNDRRAFARELYRQELSRHWHPRGLTRNDQLQIIRRHSPEWRS